MQMMKKITTDHISSPFFKGELPHAIAARNYADFVLAQSLLSLLNLI